MKLEKWVVKDLHEENEEDKRPIFLFDTQVDAEEYISLLPTKSTLKEYFLASVEIEKMEYQIYEEDDSWEIWRASPAGALLASLTGSHARVFAKYIVNEILKGRFILRDKKCLD